MTDKPQRNRFRLNSNAIPGKFEKHIGHQKGGNVYNYDLMAIQGPGSEPVAGALYLSSKNMGSNDMMGSAKYGTTTARSNKKNKKTMAQSARKKKNEPILHDDRVQIISSNQFQNQNYRMPIQAHSQSKYIGNTISAVNFSTENIDPMPPSPEELNAVGGAYDDPDSHDPDHLKKLKDDKKARRREKFSRRLQIVKNREKIELENKEKAAAQKQQQESLLANQAPILKSKVNLSPEVVSRKDQQLQNFNNENILRKQNTGKSRKQVSISVQPDQDNEPKSALVAKQDRNPKQVLKKGDSNDSITLLRLPGQNKQIASDFTLSSNENNMGNEAVENEEGNSIISEEDSAFEDQTPMVQKQRKRSSQMWEQRENTAIDQRPKLEEKPQQIKEYKRQKTVGWKNQPDIKKHYQRSPTNQSNAPKQQARQNSQESGNVKRFKMKLIDAKEHEHRSNKSKMLDIRNRSGSKYRHKQGVSGGSRHSSLNYISDAMIDQLSMNFGKKYGQRGGYQNENIAQDTNSVVSILTKGGTVMNPFNRDQNSQQNRNLSIYNTNVRQSRNYQSNSQLHDKKHPEVASGELVMQKNKVASKTNVQFDTQGDDTQSLRDLRNSIQFTNKNMIKVYLKTPYKVLSIKDINKKFKGKEQLFQAENQLQIHTEFRNPGQLTVNKKFLRQKSLGKTNTSMVHQGSSHSQLSETKGSAYFDGSQMIGNTKGTLQVDGNRILAAGGMELDSQGVMNNSIYASENRVGQITTTSNSIQARHQRQNLDQEFKQHFYESLREQIIRRINQVNFQTNIYKKQQKLYSIYGQGAGPKDAKKADWLYTDQGLRVFELFDHQSIQDLHDSSIRDHNFSISPELTNYELNNLKLQQLNVDSRDSLLTNEGHILAAKTFDNKAGNPVAAQPDPDQNPTNIIQGTPKTLNNEPMNYKYQTMGSHENINRSIGEDAAGGSGMRDQLRYLLDQSSSMGYPSNMIRELQKLETILVNAERDLEIQMRRRDLQRLQQQKEVARSYSPDKYTYQNRDSKAQIGKLILAKDEKQFQKNQSQVYAYPSSLGFRKSPPIRMDSYQDSLKKKKNQLLPTKEYVDETSFDGDNSLGQIGMKQNGIQLNFSTIQDPNASNSNIREQNWRSIDSSVDIKDYFENKISMRRSIDKKLHYDHIRNQVPNPQHQSMRKHQKLLERKIFYKSQKMRQMAQNAQQMQVESVTINEPAGTKVTMNSSMKEKINEKRQSNHGESSFTIDQVSNAVTPVKNMGNNRQSRNTLASGNTIGHSKAYQNLLPMMPNVEDYMKKSPGLKNKKKSGKLSLDGGGAVLTHLPQIKSTQSNISQTKSKQIGFNQKNEQSLKKSPRSSYADIYKDEGGTVMRKDGVLDEDLSTHLEKSGISLKKQNYRLERSGNQKYNQQINSSKMTQKKFSNNDITYKNNKEIKQLSMPHLKEEKFTSHEKYSLKKSKFNTPVYNWQVAAGNGNPDQKKLGFQFKNKSPRVIPPGALREFAYVNTENDMPINKNIDYADNEFLLQNESHTSIQAKQSYGNNHHHPNFPSIHQNGKIFAASGPAIVSPSHLQSLSKFKNNNFDKNQHLMKGVLTQQRRFSKIISNKQNKKLKLDLSNSDLNQLFINQQRGRNSMASSLPSKQAANQEQFTGTAMQMNAREQNDQITAVAPQTGIRYTEPDGERQQEVNGPVM